MDKILFKAHSFLAIQAIICLLIGLLVWIVPLFNEDFFPVNIHRYFVINGFFLSFIFSLFLKKYDYQENVLYIISFPLVFILGFIYLQYTDGQKYFLINSLLQFFILGFFLLKKKNNFMMILSIVLNISLNLFEYYESYSFFGSDHFIGYVILIFALLDGKSNLKRISLFSTLLIITLLIPYKFRNYIQSFLLLGSCFPYFNRSKKYFDWGISIGLFNILLAYLLPNFMRNLGIHLTHVLFIGGFVLALVSIGLRSYFPNSNSKFILWFIGLMEFTMLTRVSAFYMKEAYESHLAYASILILVTFILFCIFYIKQRKLVTK